MSSVRVLTFLWSVLVPVMLGGCDEFPKDPNQTLERVRDGTMRVGIIEQQPWAVLEEGRAQGIEVDLVRKLAESLGAEIEWAHATGTAALQALIERRIDLLIGGQTEDGPWSTEVAFTRPYLTYGLVVAAPAGAAMTNMDGEPVRVPPGSALAADVEDKGGVAVVKDEAGVVLRAKPVWQVSPEEQVVAVLRQARHVVAVPRGENAWLIHVDKFFSAQRESVWRALTAMAEQ